MEASSLSNPVAIGNALLYLGDCLEVMKQLPDGSVDAVITDPPYGVDYQSAWRSDKAQWKPKIANDTKPFIWWLHDAYKMTVMGGALLSFCRWDVQEAFKQAIGWAGFTIKSQIIWDREVHGMGDLKGQFAPQHDVVWFASKGRCELRGTRPKSVIRSKRISAEVLTHPNEKPVDLMGDLIVKVTDTGRTVLDPMMGSGTTGVACANLGRKFIGIEIEPKYFDIACKRIEQAQMQERLSLA